MLKHIENYQQVAEKYLRQICDACNGTSAWLSKHDFKKRVATVVAESITEIANPTEKMGDIGEQYPEGIKSEIWTWLRSENPQPFFFHVEEIKADELERYEYLEDDVQSVLCYVVKDDDHIWGFVEVWDTRAKHSFTAQEINAGQTIIPQLEAALHAQDTND